MPLPACARPRIGRPDILKGAAKRRAEADAAHESSQNGTARQAGAADRGSLKEWGAEGGVKRWKDGRDEPHQ
jgi:hypothetical protein